MNICAICNETFDQHEESIVMHHLPNKINLNKNHKHDQIKVPVMDYSLNASERLNLKSYTNNDNTIINLDLKNLDNSNNTNIKNLIGKENVNVNEVEECNVIDTLNINPNADKKENSNFHLIKKMNKFDLPDEIKSELENPNLCGICFNSDITVEKCVKFSCNHIFCLVCVKTYLEKNIQNGKVKFFFNKFLILKKVLKINCMYGGCPIKINEKLIHFIVDEDYKTKYIRFYREQTKKLSQNIINCPYPDCNDLIEYDPTFKKRFYKCQNDHSFCSVCKNNQPHDENKCKKVN